MSESKIDINEVYVNTVIDHEGVENNCDNGDYERIKCQTTENRITPKRHKQRYNITVDENPLFCAFRGFHHHSSNLQCTVIQTVDGQWTDWSPWDTCTLSCGNGTWIRIRTCTNPVPTNGGKACAGKSSETSDCYLQLCPALLVGFSDSGNTMISHTLLFSSVKTNYGNGYSSSTGKFTCSYPGLYFFALSLIKARADHSVADMASCYIYTNTTAFIQTRTDPRDDDTDNGSYETSAFLVVQLRQGDTVYVSGCSSAGSIDSLSSFSGFLLKSD